MRALSLRDILVYGSASAANFALAAAARLSDTVRAVALTSPRIGRPSQRSDSPYGRLFWDMLNNSYGLELTARLFRRMRVAGWAQQLMLSYSITHDRDRLILESPGMLDFLAAQTNDAVHRSVDGALAEFRLLQSNASFGPSRVAQPIRVWQGAEDRTLSLADTLRAFEGAPNAAVDVVPDAGVLMNETEAATIASWLAEGWKAQAPAAKQAVG